MSSFIDSMFQQAKKDRKRIVLPEGDDERTLEAAEIILQEGIADLVVIGDAAAMSASRYALDDATLVDLRSSDDVARYAQGFYELRKSKGITIEQAQEKMNDPLYFGAMMVKSGDADGMVAGACHSTSDTLRSALQCVKTAPDANYVSSFFVMCVPDCDYGQDGTYLFSDCGLNIQPSVEMLADEALSSAATWRMLMGSEPKVAMLSHSTFGSAADNDDRDKVVRAVERAKEIAPDLLVDGEMQLDAAIVPSVAASKAPDSPVAGQANVLIFPDLDAGNIGYKLVQRFAKAEAYGPITQGLAAPVNDLSRGCSANDIVGVVAITCVQAQGQS